MTRTENGSVPWLFGFFRPGRLLMSNEPAAPSRGNKVRRIITGCLLLLAVLCVGWIVLLMTSGKVGAGGGPSDKGKGFDALANLVPPIAALDVLALIALG